MRSTSGKFTNEAMKPLKIYILGNSTIMKNSHRIFSFKKRHKTKHPARPQLCAATPAFIVRDKRKAALSEQWAHRGRSCFLFQTCLRCTCAAYGRGSVTRAELEKEKAWQRCRRGSQTPPWTLGICFKCPNDHGQLNLLTNLTSPLRPADPDPGGLACLPSWAAAAPYLSWGTPAGPWP